VKDSGTFDRTILAALNTIMARVGSGELSLPEATRQVYELRMTFRRRRDHGIDYSKSPIR